MVLARRIGTALVAGDGLLEENCTDPGNRHFDNCSGGFYR